MSIEIRSLTGATLYTARAASDVRAAAAVTGIVGDYLAAFRPPLTPVSVLGGTWPCGGVDECYCGTDKDVRPFPGYTSGPDGIEDRDQPLGEYPDLPNVPAPAWATAPAPVPGGGSPAAAGDHSTSALLDEAAWSIAKLASGRPGNHDALDDLITELYERAEACRAVEAMTRPLGDMLTDAAVETDQLAALGDPAYLVPRANLSDALIAAAALVSRAVPHPADLSGGASKRVFLA